MVSDQNDVGHCEKLIITYFHIQRNAEFHKKLSAEIFIKVFLGVYRIRKRKIIRNRLQDHSINFATHVCLKNLEIQTTFTLRLFITCSDTLTKFIRIDFFSSSVCVTTTTTSSGDLYN